MSDIVYWNWEDRTVIPSGGELRPMTSAENVSCRIFDAETGKEITHVLSYDTRDQNLIRLALKDGHLVAMPMIPARLATIDERREVRIELREKLQ